MSKYEIELTANEHRIELYSLASDVQKMLIKAQRSRAMRPSEKAMTIATWKRKHIAVLMAVDLINEILTRPANVPKPAPIDFAQDVASKTDVAPYPYGLTKSVGSI